jgi:hypothetical protein
MALSCVLVLGVGFLGAGTLLWPCYCWSCNSFESSSISKTMS